MNAEEMANKCFYLVKSVIRHRYRKGLCLLPSGKDLELKKLPGNPFS